MYQERLQNHWNETIFQTVPTRLIAALLRTLKNKMRYATSKSGRNTTTTQWLNAVQLKCALPRCRDDCPYWRDCHRPEMDRAVPVGRHSVEEAPTRQDDLRLDCTLATMAHGTKW